MFAKLFSPSDVRLRASIDFTRLETVTDSFESVPVRLFQAILCLVVCSFVLRSTMTSTPVRRFLNREVGECQDIVPPCVIFVLHRWKTGQVPQSQ